MTSKTLKLFKFELDLNDYVPEIHTSANFHFNPFSGPSPQIDELLRFCDFFLVVLGYTVTVLDLPGGLRGFDPQDRSLTQPAKVGQMYWWGGVVN